MIVVHHLEASRSQRVLWLLEELGLEYEIRPYKRDPKTYLAPASLKQVHPLGKSPVITDGDVTVAESGAIVEYLVGKYGKGRLVPPEGTDARMRYTFWLHYAEGSAMPPLLLKFVFQMMPKQSPFWIRPVVQAISRGVCSNFVDPQVATHMRFWEESLSKSRWFAGDEFTAADIMMSFPVELSQSRGGFTGEVSRLQAFLSAIRERPAYQRAAQRGDFKTLP